MARKCLSRVREDTCLKMCAAVTWIESAGRGWSFNLGGGVSPGDENDRRLCLLVG